MGLSQKKINEYISLPNTCPYCGSTEITGDPIDVETEERDIECLDCGKSWKEVWSITNIREDEGDPDLQEYADEDEDENKLLDLNRLI